MNNSILDSLRTIMQDDVGRRGLGADPERNLLNAYPDDFRLACRSIADHPHPRVAIVTGFFIPTATPPAGETDGPLGALFLARALGSLGIPSLLVTDDFCVPALEAGLADCLLSGQVPTVTLPTPVQASAMSEDAYWNDFAARAGAATLTHLLAIERVGPSHVIAAVPEQEQNRCHTMRGRDITDLMSPAHRLFEAANRSGAIITIGIGDGGNEIGMGKIPWSVIDRNIPLGGVIACRIPTRHLLVCGVSNWGAYALATGIAHLRGQPLNATFFEPERERRILDTMVRHGPLVDGVLGQPSATVDGLSWHQYAQVLMKMDKANSLGVSPA